MTADSFLLQYEERVSFEDDLLTASRTLTGAKSVNEEGDQDFATLQMGTMTMTEQKEEADQDAPSRSFLAIPREA